MPNIPDLHHVRGSTCHDEGAEAHEHPMKGQVASLADEIDQGDGYREVGGSDKCVGDQMQPDQTGIP